MVITLFDMIQAEGNADELALYTTLVFNGINASKRILDKEEMQESANELFRILDEGRKQKGGTNG